MPKPETVPNPAQGLGRAAEKAADAGVAHVEAAAAAFEARFAEGFPPSGGDGSEDENVEAGATLIDELPESLDDVLGNFLGNAPNAPGITIAATHFPHADDFPSLPTETLFGSTADV